MIKNYLSYAVAAALLAASGTSNLAFAQVVVVEQESNNSKPQRLTFDASKQVEVQGIIGTNVPLGMGNPIEDIDWYSFVGQAGNTVAIDIDGGIKASGTEARSLDSVIAIYGPNLPMQTRDDMASGEEDEPNTLNSKRDPRIENITLPTTGEYIVGVAGTGRRFLPLATGASWTPDGTVTPYSVKTTGNGSYRLIISGVSPSVQPITIDIKPGARSIGAPINMKSKGKIPVALIRTDAFDPLKADLDSIKFGRTGTEAKGRCGKNGEDVNGDGRLDLVCHFETQDTKFEASSEVGKLTGTIEGTAFEGTGDLKVIHVKQPD